MVTKRMTIALVALFAFAESQSVSSRSQDFLLPTKNASIVSPGASTVQSLVHVGSRANIGSDLNKVVGTGSGSEEPNSKQKALKVSPQDKTFDSHKIDDDEKFHAPSLAPNDKQSDPTDIELEEKLSEKTTTGESEKGSKGSVILGDYDPNRLGVSADEAHGAKKDTKAKDAKGYTKDSTTTNKKDGKSGQEKDAKQAVEDNKAPPKDRSKPTVRDNTEKKELEKSESEEAASRKHDAMVHDAVNPTKENPIEYMAEVEAVENHKFGRLIGSAMMIVVSEIGDKTFFIAALMAMRHPPWFVFSSSYSAMVVMTILSMVLGLILPSLLSRKVTTLLAALLFLVFGARMVQEAYYMDKNLAATEEMEEVEHDIALSDNTRASEKAEGGGEAAEVKFGTRIGDSLNNLAQLMFSPVWIQIFAMTFLGEWGDRSQIATVAMGAGEGWFQVLAGCLSGHFITTIIAILGGKILAKHLSLRTITFGGAVCFLMFAVFYFRDWTQQL